MEQWSIEIALITPLLPYSDTPLLPNLPYSTTRLGKKYRSASSTPRPLS